jgi:hypothetical protein
MFSDSIFQYITQIGLGFGSDNDLKQAQADSLQ